jgi:hypothetical protein
MIQLRLKDDTFLKVQSGELSEIRHGYSKNKKYLRIFSARVVQLFNSNKTQSVIKNISCAIITTENNHKIFKISLA